jgi:polynucleotide 5'-kinase involved in rRNA processing
MHGWHRAPARATLAKISEARTAAVRMDRDRYRRRSARAQRLREQVAQTLPGVKTIRVGACRIAIAPALFSGKRVP